MEDLQPKKKKDRAFCGSGKKKSEKKKRGRRSGKRNDWRQKRKQTGKAEKKRLVLWKKRLVYGDYQKRLVCVTEKKVGTYLSHVCNFSALPVSIQ